MSKTAFVQVIFANILSRPLSIEPLAKLRPAGPIFRRKVIHTLERVRLEEFTGTSWCGVGRLPFEERFGDQLIGPLRRDGTAIEAREHRARKEVPAAETAATATTALLPVAESPAETTAPETPGPARKRGRPRCGEARAARKPRRSGANAGKRWRKCSTRFPQRVIAA